MDVERFTDPARPRPHMRAVRDGLYHALHTTFAEADIDWQDCYVEDRGDGAFILVPAQVHKNLLTSTVPAALAKALATHNQAHDQPAQIKLRMALHAGEISHDDHGVTGTALNLAFRLLDAEPLKHTLAESPGVLAVITSPWFYDEVVRHDPASAPDAYRLVQVTVKQTRTSAWICRPDAPYRPGEQAAPDRPQPGRADRHRPSGTEPDRPPVPPPRTLWRDLPDFTGRDAEIDRLTATARPAGVVVIHTVDGMAGAGKTSLVVHAAHQLADRFPDGQLCVSLNAHTPGRPPDDPADVLHYLLTRIGIEVRHIPDGLDERAGLWRDRLVGKRMLLVLDDAANGAQVEPLLPGTGECLVLITSRHRIAALDGAIPLALETLPPDDAAQLFARLARRTPLTATDREAVAAIVESCGYLPLAIALIAGSLSHRPQQSLTECAAEFTATPNDRLGRLDTGGRSVAAAFGLSYRNLSAGRQRFFRRLGLHPGTVVDAYAAAALNNVSPAVARDELEALYDDHLIDSPVTGRFRFHDLVRVYARSLADQDPADTREQALRRLLGHYQHTAETADRLIALMPRPEVASLTAAPTARPDLRDQSDALTWMRTERANLLACLDRADATGWFPPVIGLTAAMASFLHKEGPWRQAADLHQRAASRARGHGDRLSLSAAGALNDLGRIHQALGRYPDSAKAYQRSLQFYRASGNHLGEANVLSSMGNLKQVTDDHWSGRESHREALELYRASGNRLGEANALSNVARSQLVLGEYADAADLLQEALELYRASGNRLGQANALTVLGRVRYMREDFQGAAVPLREALDLHDALGNSQGKANALLTLANVRETTSGFPAAVELYRQALDLYRSLGNRHGEGNTLNSLGAALNMTGEPDAAADVLRQALDLWKSLGNRQGEGNALFSLGCVLNTTNKYEAAADMLQQALDIFQDLQDRIGKANTFHALGHLQQMNKNFAAAADLFQKALAQWQDLDHHLGQAEVLISQGALMRESAQPREAVAPYQQALRIALQRKSLLEEARAREGIAHCHALTCQWSSARAALRRAVAIYQRLGATEAGPAADTLDDWESR